MVAKSASSKASNRNGRLIRWVVLAIVVLSVMVFGLLGLSRRRSPHLWPAPEDATEALQFVPQNAVLTASLLTAPDDFFSRFSAAISLQTTFNQRTGLNYDRDARPWLGPGVVFSMLPRRLQRDEPDYLVAVSVTSGDRAREFLELLWQRQVLLGQPVTLTTIDGANAFIPGAESALWPMALVGNRYLLIASTVSALYRSLRAAQTPVLNLPHRDAYQVGLSVLPSAALGVLHLDVPAALVMAGLAQSSPSAPVNELLVSVTTEQRNVNLHTVLLPELRSNDTTNSSVTPALFQPSTVNSAVSELPTSFTDDRLVPASTPVAMLPKGVTALAVGDDLAHVWHRLTHGLPFYRQWLGDWSQFQTGRFGSLGAAVMPILETWLTDGYVIARTGSGEGILLTEHTPKTAMATARLDQLAQQQDLTVTPLTVQQRPVTAWTRLRTQTHATRNRQDSAHRETVVQTDVVALHTVYKGYDLWATSVAALSDTLDATGEKLVNKPQFQQRVKPQNHGEYLYLDGKALVPQLLGQLPLLDLLGIAVNPILDTLETALISPISCATDRGAMCQQLDVDLWFTPAE